MNLKEKIKIKKTNFLTISKESKVKDSVSKLKKRLASWSTRYVSHRSEKVMIDLLCKLTTTRKRIIKMLFFVNIQYEIREQRKMKNKDRIFVNKQLINFKIILRGISIIFFG